MTTLMNQLTKRINLLLLTAFCCGTSIHLNAQCSEAENPTMRKYAELTRTGDAQACSQCAWLANLFCIAENGLYENDKAGVQKAINDTKANIKLMGDPICCPELLTKTVKWGQPKTGQGQANASEPRNKTMEDIQHFANEVNSAITTIGNLNAINKTGEQLQKDLENVEKLMNENSTLSEKEYQSEDEINSEYSIKLANLNKLAEAHLAIKSKIQSLGYSAAGELLNNSSTTGLGAFAAIGAVTSTDKKESKAYSENAKNRLQTSKSNKLFKHKYKDHDFQLDLIDNKMQEYFSKSYPENYSNLLNNSVIKGYKVGMKYKEFKKLFPKFKWKNIGPAHYQVKDYGNGSDFYFKLGLTKGDYSTVREVEQVTTYSATFSPEKLAEYQQKILEEIRHYDDLFNLNPESYKSSNNDDVTKAVNYLNTLSPDELSKLAKSSSLRINDQNILNALKGETSQSAIQQSNPLNSLTTVHWSDKTNKSFSLNARLTVSNDKINLEIRKTDKNLQLSDSTKHTKTMTISK